ncbi:hypothetical protein ACFYW9_19955 [Streptomyces sp. NPDC002698]|uniref:hypothetical protein n=1 Tax=Streptomyces sp. NPDC002698 TaxID=3364660 RepID=UPI00368D898B
MADEIVLQPQEFGNASYGNRIGMAVKEDGASADPFQPDRCRAAQRLARRQA